MSLPQFPSVTTTCFQICKSINVPTYIYIVPNYESIFEKEEEQSLLFHIGIATGRETHHLLHMAGAHGANQL